jgi:SpoVK/Ycf46/Vps4 family AAA+-type ATPase
MVSHAKVAKMFAHCGRLKSPNSSEITRDNPLRIAPITEVAINCAEILEFTAWPYQRFNGVSVLRIDAVTTTYQDFNLEQIQNWILEENGKLPFATIRLRHVENTSLQLLVTHSLVMDDLTEFQLKETLESIGYVWKKCAEKLDEMDPFEFSIEELDANKEREDDEELSRTIEQFKHERDEQDIFSRQGEGTVIDEDPEVTIESVLRELHALVGLAPVKDMVAQLTAQQRIAKHRAAHGLRAVVPSPHLVFLGNPGTGKTTVARLIGKLYKALGLLSQGHLIEADRSSLVAGYIGQTAIKTRDMCKRAVGGVLFIDEAYSLSVDGRDFGAEAIEALLTFMEAHRGDFVVVVAGYPDRMLDFLHSNPGLKSRFDLTLNFPDYSTSELVTIFDNLVEDNQYTLANDARPKLRALIESWDRRYGFGNGREIRRLFGYVIGNHAAMLAEESQFDTAALTTITAENIPKAPSRGEAASGGYVLPGYL